MAKKTIYKWYRGTVEWSHLYKPDEYKGNRFWKLNFFPASQEVYDEMREDGVQAKLKFEGENTRKFKEGAYFTLRRDCEKTFKGEVRKFNPPAIKDKDDNYLVKYVEVDGEIVRKGDPVLIGNGSEIEVLLEIYDAGQYGTGTRLLEVKIIDLIVYEKPEEVQDEPEAEEVVEKRQEDNSRKDKVPEEKPVRKSSKVNW